MPLFVYSSWVRYRPGDPWKHVATISSQSKREAFQSAEARGPVKSGLGKWIQDRYVDGGFAGWFETVFQGQEAEMIIVPITDKIFWLAYASENLQRNRPWLPARLPRPKRFTAKAILSGFSLENNP